jgi:hypothetical protein
MDVAIYLLDNGADVNESVTSGQSTPLLAAAVLGEIDILRMLLDRGASLDRFNGNGIDASIGCIVPNADRKVAAVDMLKVINEHMSFDTNAIDSLYGASFLHITACYQSASEIDFLISLEPNVEVQDHYGLNALHYAATRGNPVTYFALLAHGSTTVTLEEELLLVIDAKVRCLKRVTYDDTNGPGLYDSILKDLLHRRADLMNSIYIIDGEVEEIQGPPIPLQQAVAAYGREIEAWFLGLLQECGRLEDEKDQCRLRQLRLEGYGRHGTVIGEVDEESDHDSGDKDPENASSESGQSSAGSEADDTEEEHESFWDAEEGDRSSGTGFSIMALPPHFDTSTVFC